MRIKSGLLFFSLQSFSVVIKSDSQAESRDPKQLEVALALEVDTWLLAQRFASWFLHGSLTCAAHNLAV